MQDKGRQEERDTEEYRERKRKGGEKEAVRETFMRKIQQTIM